MSELAVEISGDAPGEISRRKSVSSFGIVQRRHWYSPAGALAKADPIGPVVDERADPASVANDDAPIALAGHDDIGNELLHTINDCRIYRDP